METIPSVIIMLVIMGVICKFYKRDQKKLSELQQTIKDIKRRQEKNKHV